MQSLLLTEGSYDSLLDVIEKTFPISGGDRAAHPGT